MNQQFSAPKNESIQETWSWPLRIDVYDTSPHLTQVEYATLENLFSRTEKHIYPSTKRPLQRIVQPIEDALLHIHALPVVYRETLRLMLHTCSLNDMGVSTRGLTRDGISLYLPICSECSRDANVSSK